MNKEEVLAKSRNEKRDEGKEFSSAWGAKRGVIGMLLVFVILSVYYLYAGRRNSVLPMLAMVFGYLAFESSGIYHITKKKSELIKIVVGSILCAAFMLWSFN